ncbi:MAG TPA: methyltransferase domain-containing protein [Kiritimatiellia bacterium]|nr:methyltransferase domain-containing protein [Kiritimatiellia bacterium]
MAHANHDSLNAYQKDGVHYVQKIARLFGGYKKRSFEFLHVAPGMNILDIGCGAGDDAIALAGLVGPDGCITGMDINDAMLETARQRALAAGVSVKFARGDAEKIPFDDNTFDRVRADRVFQHLDDLPSAIIECKRVAKPGAWITILDVDWASLLIDSSDPFLTHNILHYEYSCQKNGSAGTRLYGLLKQAGLQGVEAYAETACVTEWPIASMIWGLEVFAMNAVEAGIITKADALGWVSDLEKRDREGRFFAAITGIAVRGQKS